MSPTVQQRIEQAMAKAFFASAWADLQDEKPVDGPDAGVNLSGKDIMDVMPDDIDPAALDEAKALVFEMERVNARPIAVIYANVIVLEDGGDRDPSPENFGHYCAMQAMGHGVGLNDAFGDAVYQIVRVPHVEFDAYSLQKEY